MRRKPPGTEVVPPGSSGYATPDTHGVPGRPTGSADAGAQPVEARGSARKAGDRPEPLWLARLHARLDRIRSTASGRLALRIAVGVVGALVVAVGIVLIPLPGPGWALVILGLAIWALEFAWAKRLLHFTRRNVQKWTKWVSRRSLVTRLLLGGICLVFVATVVWASLKTSFDIDLVQMAREYTASR